MKTVKRRAYHSAQRQKQAEDTRAGVVGAARRLFATGGYQATTVDAIAAAAGVSVQTVYGVFGSKRTVMLAIADDMDVRGESTQLEALLGSAVDAREQLRIIAAFQLRFFTQNADVLETMREAGRMDEALSDLWAEGRRRHHAAYVRIAEAWAVRKALCPGLEKGEAADTLAALTWIDTYWYLVRHCKWSPERYRDWLESTISTLVLRPESRGVPAAAGRRRATPAK